MERTVVLWAEKKSVHKLGRLARTSSIITISLSPIRCLANYLLYSSNSLSTLPQISLSLPLSSFCYIYVIDPPLLYICQTHHPQVLTHLHFQTSSSTHCIHWAQLTYHYWANSRSPGCTNHCPYRSHPSGHSSTGPQCQWLLPAALSSHPPGRPEASPRQRPSTGLQIHGSWSACTSPVSCAFSGPWSGHVSSQWYWSHHSTWQRHNMIKHTGNWIYPIRHGKISLHGLI